MTGTCQATRARAAAAVSVVIALMLAPLALPDLGGAEPVTVELSVVKGSARAQRVIRVRQGDDLVLRWTTDRALTIHLHGYDLERTLVPGTPTELRVAATAAGRFAISVHEHGGGRDREMTLGFLEVHPR